jgi:hypothetical protein
LLVVVAVLALGGTLLVQQRRVERLRAALALYKRHSHKKVVAKLSSPAPGLDWPDETPLAEVIEQIKLNTQSGAPQFSLVVPVVIDPIGLQEVEKSMTSTVKRPHLADKLSLGEHLRIALDPLGLAYVVKDGCLMITSKESLDKEMGDAIDPYRMYRDVLQ